MNIELGSSLFEKEKPTCPYILHFRSQTQLYLAFAKDWLRLYMTTKETSTVNGSQLGNLLNTNQLCLQETIGFYKEIWWGFLRIVTSLIQFWGFVVSTCLHCISGIAKSQHHAPPVLALNNCITWLCPLNFSFFAMIYIQWIVVNKHITWVCPLKWGIYHDVHPVNCGHSTGGNIIYSTVRLWLFSSGDEPSRFS